MTIDELIELAENAREDLGGDAQVRIAYQPGYPRRAALCCVTVPPSTDPSDLYGPDKTAAGQQNDGTFLWLRHSHIQRELLDATGREVLLHVTGGTTSPNTCWSRAVMCG